MGKRFLSGTIMRKGTVDAVDAETGGGAPPYSTFDDKVTVVTPEGFGASFTDQKIRARFVKKVYLIILAQLVFTACVVAIFSHSQAVKQFFLSPSPNGYASSNGFILYITSYVVFFVTYIAIVCCEPVRRKHPGNIIAQMWTFDIWCHIDTTSVICGLMSRLPSFILLMSPPVFGLIFGRWKATALWPFILKAFGSRQTYILPTYLSAEKIFEISSVYSSKQSRHSALKIIRLLPSAKAKCQPRFQPFRKL